MQVQLTVLLGVAFFYNLSSMGEQSLTPAIDCLTRAMFPAVRLIVRI